jgi:hypothetical protein
MSQQTSKHSSASHKAAIPANQAANFAAPANIESKEVPAGIEGIVETLADLQTEVLLSALEASIRKKGTKMANRTLTAAAALTHVEALPDFKNRLKESEDRAMEEVAGIRAQVKLEELQTFDDHLYDRVNSEP